MGLRGFNRLKGLMYKEDWERVAETYEAWWEGELNRPILQLTCLHPGVNILDYYLTMSWAFMIHTPEEALNRLFECFSKTDFMAEAYPNVFINIGPGALSAFLGADLKFNPKAGTVWFIGDSSIDELLDVELKPENRWWRYVLDCSRYASEMCRGKAIVAFTDLLDVATSLAQLRGGPVNLIRDIYTKPSTVKEALENLHKVWFECFMKLSEAINTALYGYSNWASIWSRRRSFILQCDFITYLSPRLFDEFIYPLILEECRFFERSFWHLDGPGELPHLDKLLRIDELDGIQWVPGAGNPGLGEDCWVPLYRKIIEAGKLLQLPGVPADRVIPILERIPGKSVLIQTSTLNHGEAERLLSKLNEKYSP